MTHSIHICITAMIDINLVESSSEISIKNQPKLKKSKAKRTIFKNIFSCFGSTQTQAKPFDPDKYRPEIRLTTDN